jgi:hypothetical protein
MKGFLGRLASSVIHQATLWMFLWVLYALWAGYSPIHEGTKHCEPHFALVIFGFMAILFFLGDRRELKLLVMNSFVGVLLVGSMLLLNVYRLFADGFAQSWYEANPFLSVYAFILLQIAFLGVAVWLTRYTVGYWRAHPPVWTGRQRVGCAASLLVVGLLALLAVFYLAFGNGG